jgi:hypothetical protein
MVCFGDREMIGLRMDMKEGERKGEKGRQENSGREGQEERREKFVSTSVVSNRLSYGAEFFFGF